MDGDASHFLRLNWLRLGAMSAFSLLYFFLCCPFILRSCSLLRCIRFLFHLDCSFHLPQGPHPPEWVKPTTEGGELSGIFFLFISLLFVFAVALYVRPVSLST
jgi:hypothetical protein